MKEQLRFVGEDSEMATLSCELPSEVREANNAFHNTAKCRTPWPHVEPIKLSTP